MTTEHALLPPSDAERWAHCPGSVMLQQAYPAEEGPEAKDGTASHWAAAEMIQDRTPREGDAAPNGVFLTDEMLEAAEVYADAARGIARQRTALGAAGVVIERRVAIPRIHETLCWGTPDLRMWAPGNWLHVMDFKYGHRIVEPYENFQLMAYAAGAMSEPHVRDMVQKIGDENIKLALTIVQPRAPHVDGAVRTWTCTGGDIRGFVNRMQMAADAALAPEPPTLAGPWCRDCSARRSCLTAQREALRIVDEVGEAVPFDLTPDQLGLELRWLKRAAAVLDARISGLEVEAEALLKAGRAVPFWRIVQEPGRERWTVPADQVIALGDALQIPLGKPATVTPNQARQAGIPAEVVATMAERPLSAFKVKPDDGSAARKVFGGAA